MVKEKVKETTTTTDVLLFVPNLIGYARVALFALSLLFAMNDPIYFLSLYWMSFVLVNCDLQRENRENSSFFFLLFAFFFFF